MSHDHNDCAPCRVPWWEGGWMRGWMDERVRRGDGGHHSIYTCYNNNAWAPENQHGVPGFLDYDYCNSIDSFPY